MASNLSVVVAEGTLIVLGAPVELFVWKDRVRTDSRVRDAITNVDVCGVEVVVATPALGVAAGYARIPDSMAAGLRAGDYLRIAGERLTATIDSRKDSRDIRVSIEGVETAEPCGAFSHVVKTAK